MKNKDKKRTSLVRSKKVAKQLKQWCDSIVIRYVCMMSTL